jgi:hypothetical protein
MAQSTRFQVPITARRRFRLVVPPLPEQRAIAKVVSDVDELIGAGACAVSILAVSVAIRRDSGTERSATEVSLFLPFTPKFLH